MRTKIAGARGGNRSAQRQAERPSARRAHARRSARPTRALALSRAPMTREHPIRDDNGQCLSGTTSGLSTTRQVMTEAGSLRGFSLWGDVKAGPG